MESRKIDFKIENGIRFYFNEEKLVEQDFYCY